MKIKISNHNKKKYEINEILRVVKVEIFIVQIQCNKFFKIQRIREKKINNEKKLLNYQSLKKIQFRKKFRFEFKTRSFKQFDFFIKKFRFDFKMRSFKYFILFYFFEHKNFNTF